MPTFSRVFASTHAPLPVRSLNQSVRPSIVAQSRLLVPRPQPCRPLHLYKLARSKTLLGLHKILPFDRYETPPPSQSSHKVQLSDGCEPRAKHYANVSFSKLLTKHVRPGRFLIPTTSLSRYEGKNVDQLKQDDRPAKYRSYRLARAAVPTSDAPGLKVADREELALEPPKLQQQWGRLKGIHMNLISPVLYQELCLQRAFNFLLQGHVVEFQMRTDHVKVDKKQKIESADPEGTLWLHNHFPHMRPDVILKSMPEGAYFLVDPVSSGRVVQFVMAMPLISGNKNDLPVRQKLTSQVFHKKSRLKGTIDSGQQGELPKVLRQKLIEEGNDAYSLMSARTKELMMRRPHDLDDQIEFGEASLPREGEATRKFVVDGRRMSARDYDITKMQRRQKDKERRRLAPHRMNTELTPEGRLVFSQGEGVTLPMGERASIPQGERAVSPRLVSSSVGSEHDPFSSRDEHDPFSSRDEPYDPFSRDEPDHVPSELRTALEQEHKAFMEKERLKKKDEMKKYAQKKRWQSRGRSASW